MAKRHELQLERHAAVHAGDAIQTRPERPGFLRRMRLLGGTGGLTIQFNPRLQQTRLLFPEHAFLAIIAAGFRDYPRNV